MVSKEDIKETKYVVSMFSLLFTLVISMIGCLAAGNAFYYFRVENCNLDINRVLMWMTIVLACTAFLAFYRMITGTCKTFKQKWYTKNIHMTSNILLFLITLPSIGFEIYLLSTYARTVYDNRGEVTCDIDPYYTLTPQEWSGIYLGVAAAYLGLQVIYLTWWIMYRVLKVSCMAFCACTKACRRSVRNRKNGCVDAVVRCLRGSEN